MRKLMLAGGLAAVGLFAVGCDTAPPTSKSTSSPAREAEQRAREAGAAVGKATDAAGDAAKETVVKPVEEMYAKVEEKLKGLTGDTLTKAKEKFEAVKNLVTEFKASPADGMAAIKDKLMTAVEELKKLVGL